MTIESNNHSTIMENPALAGLMKALLGFQFSNKASKAY